MKKKLLMIGAFVASVTFAQNESDYWIFGRTLSPTATPTTLNFDPAAGPAPVTDISTTANLAPAPNNITTADAVAMSGEGSAVVTDPITGELYFYTDGRNVWNANHVQLPIPGGGTLGAAASSAQPVAVCPTFHCPNDEYYIFSNRSADATVGGITYRTFNRTTNTFGPQINLTTYWAGVTEGMVLIPTKNNPEECWLVCHLRNTNQFQAWRINATGIAAFPVTTVIGPSFPDGTIGSSNKNVGNIAYSGNTPSVAFSATNYEVAVTNNSINPTTDDKVFTLIFNSNTGFFSAYNPISNDQPGNEYDVEFSPDGTKLYFTTATTAGGGGIFQYDYLAPAVPALVSVPDDELIYGIKKGPDNLLYYLRRIASPATFSVIGQITAPNNPAATCGAIEPAWGGPTVNVLAQNFPEFVHFDPTDNGSWHQTTKAAGKFDQINDVATDSRGNVYVTGSFTGTTTFNGGAGTDVTVTTTVPKVKAAAIAKYNECGDLLWVVQDVGAYASPTGSEGTGIVLDEANGRVYVTGTFDQDIQFNHGVGDEGFGAGSGPVLSGVGVQGFVVGVMMNNGFVRIQTADIPPTSSPTSITINENSGVGGTDIELFVGGYFDVPSNRDAFVFKYSFSPTAFVTGPPTAWNVLSVMGTPGHEQVNSIDFDESQDRLWITGTFNKMLDLSPAGAYGPFASSSATQAFAGAYDNGATATQHWLGIAGNTAKDSEGNGISVDELTGKVYMTGTYNGKCINVFGLGEAWLDTDPGSNAYHFAIQSYPGGVPTVDWSRETSSPAGGNVSGVDVAFRNRKAHFVGNYGYDLLFEAGPSMPFVGGVPSPNVGHIYTVDYEEITGDLSNENVTRDPVTSSQHNAKAICSGDNGVSFFVGNYSGRMDGLYGTGASGILISTPVSFTIYNGFVMRTQQADGTMRSSMTNGSDVVVEEEESIVVKDETMSFKLYPNPTVGDVIFELENFDPAQEYQLEVLSLTGQKVLSVVVTETKSSVDLSDLRSGTYLVSVSNSEGRIVKRVVKK